MTTKDIGNLGETAAAKFLKKQGFKILSRNVHISHNEIDIIAYNKKIKLLAFAEVKTRSVESDLYSKYGTPASSVTPQKQKRTITAARNFLAQNSKFLGSMIRFDVVEIYIEKSTFEILKINHIENAFSA